MFTQGPSCVFCFILFLQLQQNVSLTACVSHSEWKYRTEQPVCRHCFHFYFVLYQKFKLVMLTEFLVMFLSCICKDGEC